MGLNRLRIADFGLGIADLEKSDFSEQLGF